MKDGVGKIEFAWSKRWKERRITLSFIRDEYLSTLRYSTLP